MKGLVGTKRPNVFLVSGVFLVCLLLSHSSAAQCVDKDNKVGVIDRVDYDHIKTPMRIEVSFSKRITPTDLRRAPQQTWVIVDIMQASVERPVYVVRFPERGDKRPLDAAPQFSTVLLYLNQALESSHKYRLFQSSLTFQDCKPDEPLEAAVKVKAEPAPPGGVVQAPPKESETNFFSKSKSEGREDSNFYIAGQIEGARKAKVQFSSDIKVDVPMGTAGVFDSIGPFFNLKASTAKDADANSMNFGAKLRHSHVIHRKVDGNGQFVEPDSRLLTGLVFDLMPSFESDRRFKNVNTVLGTRLHFIPRVHGGSTFTYFQPFIGYEIGRNLKSPVNEASGRGISRALIGGSLYFDLFPKQIKGASLQIDYVRRFLLRREVGFKEDDDGKLIPLGIGRGPRDYLKGAFGLDFSDFTGLTLSYEYGRLPPSFQLVDSKFSFGLVYKFKTSFPAKE